MPDTIHFNLLAAIRPDFAKACRFSRDWLITESTTNEFKSLRVHCRPLGLTMWGDGTLIRRVEAQLPVIINGHNGRLIKSQQEFDLANKWLYYFLTRVLYSPDGNRLLPTFPNIGPAFEYTRIDFPWHFPASMNLRVLLAHATHPRIKKGSRFNDGETVSMASTALKVMAYDKCSKMRRKGGAEVTHGGAFDRLEVSIKKLGLAAGGNSYAAVDGCGRSYLTFPRCKYILRRVLDELSIGIIDTAKVSPTIPGFFAACEALHSHRGIPELYCQIRGMRPVSKSRLFTAMRKELALCRSIIPWDEILPSDREWPTPPEIIWPEKEQAHNTWLQQQVDGFGTAY